MFRVLKYFANKLDLQYIHVLYVAQEQVQQFQSWYLESTEAYYVHFKQKKLFLFCLFSK